VFRISYKGLTTRPISGSGLLGFDLPLGTGSANSLAVEFQLDVAPNHAHPPFTDYDIVALGATVGLRHRF
jgi:hypothetical protein